jgi:tyrosyl-tRNA synthetase
MRDRGFLHQCTGWRDLDDLLLEAEEEEERGGEGESEEGEAAGEEGHETRPRGPRRPRRPVRAYLGFDATADSLHVGSLLQIMVLRWFQRCGHQPIVLLGGGTSKVGDPTGKDESRAMLGDDDIRRNIRGISAVFAKFLRLRGEAGEGVGGEGEKEGEGASATAAIVVNNDDWLSQLSYLDFLRDYGTHFTVNRMLSFESVKQRLAREAPLTFLEFNYMVLQAYDFLELHRRYGAVLQLGGSDQWGNMVAGVELGRRAGGGARLHALTAPLITTSDGRKMGKTASGAVWLNPDRLGPYGYWQFWRNTADGDVVRFLKLFTELDLADIKEMEGWTGSRINQAKAVLADRATELLHGPDVLPGIHETALQLFSGGGAVGGGGAASPSPSSTEGLARVRVTRGRLLEAEGAGIRVADLLVELGLAPSKKEARRLIAGGGARKSAAAGSGAGGGLDARIDDELAALTLDDFASSPEVVLRAGKKRAGVVELSD